MNAPKQAVSIIRTKLHRPRSQEIIFPVKPCMTYLTSVAGSRGYWCRPRRLFLKDSQVNCKQKAGVKQTAGATMNVKSMPFVIMGLLTFFLAVQPVLATETSDDEWEFSAGVYLWAADIPIETASGEDIEITFDDIIEDLDMAFMGIFGAQKGKWGFQADVIYFDVDDDSNDSLGRFGLLTLTNIELKAAIVTPTASYRVLDTDRLHLHILGGLRYLYLDIEVDIDPLPALEPDGDSTDGIVGFKGDIQLNEKWRIPFYYDVGKGDSELTYQADIGIDYRVSSFDLGLHYRYLKFKFDEDEEFGKAIDNIVVKGPMFGFKYLF
jgi:hypothetical protein